MLTPGYIMVLEVLCTQPSVAESPVTFHLFPQTGEAQSLALVIVYIFGQPLMICYSLNEF